MEGVSWIDYVIASEDPADRALASEFAANWAVNHAVRKRLLAEGPARETLAVIECNQAITNEIHSRVAARGREIEASGDLPAAEGVFEAWIDLELRPRPLF
jgi:hypothetical protein